MAFQLYANFADLQDVIIIVLICLAMLLFIEKGENDGIPLNIINNYYHYQLLPGIFISIKISNFLMCYFYI